ncbi:hypothetical protein HYH02_008079 [Chlamydomonas schloesseri]|uniref:Tafazzin family protein n=1 Tax=Chlamydomonas schloesseri TaxID=2026947 RepID=A0A835WG28_9CHLO|nr:hypothetical protein HYH02_008079 [Chlamydomonas schloesseri]|eukprot:KAG2446924.1 hypothetical protein HYH02_008079 [Chlamydomonas schloesseri]
MLNVINTTTIHGQDRLIQAVEEQKANGRGLITVCNHTSMFDDPGVLSLLMPWHWLWSEPLTEKVRWSICAKEVCFKNELLRHFFLNGKTLPVERGKGVYQPVVSIAAHTLAKGGWVHLFPEGRINYDGKLGPLRWGVGKLICEARQLNGGRDPALLPFYHSGMGEVLPITMDRLNVGRSVEVRVGEHIKVDDLTCNCDSPDMAVQQETWKAITARVRAALLELEAQCPTNPDQTDVAPKREPPPS